MHNLLTPPPPRNEHFPPHVQSDGGEQPSKSLAPNRMRGAEGGARGVGSHEYFGPGGALLRCTKAIYKRSLFCR